MLPEGSFSKKQLSTLFPLKEKITKMLHSHLDYKFNCSICNYIYFGESKRHFRVRTCDHLELTSLNWKKVKSAKESAVFDHIFHMRHTANFADFEILDE